MEPNLTASVIIPTFNRKESLLKTLASLSRQTFPAGDFEVIVVDDGGSDGTEKVEQAEFPFALWYFHQANQGDHIARNHGAEQSGADILVFLDDDITVNQDYLAILVQEHREHEHAIVLATIENVPEQDDSLFGNLFDRVIPVDHRASDNQNASLIDCMSGILSMRREDYVSVGMMQLLPGGRRNKWGGVDLGYRACQQNIVFRRCPDAIAYHSDHVINSLASYCQNSFSVSKAAPLLFVKYPELENMIPMFRDKGPISFSKDSPSLMVRKLMRIGASKPLSVWVMRLAARVLEARAPQSQLLVLLYRWIVSSCIFDGYRQGLRERADVKV